MNKTTNIRFGVGVASVALLLSACSSKSDNNSQSGTAGGTLYILTAAEQILHLDPQRNYTGEDLAFASGFLNRTLTQYAMTKDNNAASQIQADLATDTGTASDGGKTWEFTLRDGVKWEDGKPVTCADVAYGVSRTFATDVITDGPTYAISLLDIPKADGVSEYPGPYKASAAQQALFDKAVVCDGNKLTFNLGAPTADFNYAVTLSAFAPVRKDADTGERYDDSVLSNGPYKIASYVKNSKLVLVRNDQWSKDTDPIRPAFPDSIEYVFSIAQPLLTQRLMKDSGKDAMAISPDGVDPTQLAVIFGDAKYTNRRLNDYDPYVRYIAINTKKVPNVKHRQAMLAALNRADLRKIAGGKYAGDDADGVVKPNIGQDYAATGLWDGLLGEAIPDTGNVALAKKLIAESGEKFPNPIVFDYGQSPTADKSASAIVAAMARAGIVVKPNPIEVGAYYGVVLDPAKQGSLSAGGWGPDWSNASTVLPELFTPGGGFNLSQFDDKAFTAESDAAKAIADRVEQAAAWQALNVKAAELALVIPTRFGKEQRIQGSMVQGAYIWGPYGSYPYGALSVSQ